MEAARRSATVPTGGSCGCSTSTSRTTSATSSTSGAPAPRSTSWSPHEGPVGAAPGRLDRRPRSPSRSRSPTTPGVAHGRLVPENVLIDQPARSGSSASRSTPRCSGLPAGRMSTDVTDLAGLLYCLLTGKWPGVSRSAVPAAPLENGRVLRPRQVQAGVPRPLDTLCDQVLNAQEPPARDARARHARTGSATRCATSSATSPAWPRPRLRPAGATARRARRRDRSPWLGRAGSRPAPSRARPRPSPRPSPAAATPEPAPEPTPGADPSAAPAESADLPTQAGVPIFDDENDEVSWLRRARREAAAPAAVRGASRAAALRARPGRRAARPAQPRPARPRPGVAGVLAVGRQHRHRQRRPTGSGVIPVPEDEERGRRGARPQLAAAGRRWSRACCCC